ncbi:MAG: hypothetical protein M3N46_05125 [Actinomycetota bacterium]|nr:hypothetical protein [Actinomycetota bacterium]
MHPDSSLTRTDLLRSGMTVRQIAAAVHAGRLIRLRRGHYGRPELDGRVQAAVRVGGRLACVSELELRGIWILVDREVVHVHVASNAARLRDPTGPGPRRPESECVVHWVPLLMPARATTDHVSVLDALVQSIGCLPPRAAIAALDSALHLGKIRPRDIRSISAATPLPRRWILGRLDSASESGLESFVRFLAQELGFRVRTQVWVTGAGGVDVMIEDWIAVETDGDAFHDAATSPRDRRRDAAVAASGRTPLRFRYAQVVFTERAVALAIIGAVRSHRRVRNSGAKAARALARLTKLRLT